MDGGRVSAGIVPHSQGPIDRITAALDLTYACWARKCEALNAVGQRPASGAWRDHWTAHLAVELGDLLDCDPLGDDLVDLCPNAPHFEEWELLHGTPHPETLPSNVIPLRRGRR